MLQSHIELCHSQAAAFWYFGVCSGEAWLTKPSFIREPQPACILGGLSRHSLAYTLFIPKPQRYG
jgi:hypothetical protein